MDQSKEIESFQKQAKNAEILLVDNERKHEEEKVKLKSLIEQNLTKAHTNELNNLQKQLEKLKKSKDILNKELNTKK